VATSVTFLTPLGALLALGALLPLLALVAIRRRANGLRRVVGVPRISARRVLVPLGALVLAGLLLGAAAAQPVLQRTSTRQVRTDVEVYVVLDVSRSMLARTSPGARTRLARAKAAASAFRHSVPELAVGVASVTDRVLPHLFPSTDVDVFDATVERAIGIERPPPQSSIASNATSLGTLERMRGLRFFRADSEKRLVVVYTDGETQPVAVNRFGTILRRSPAIEILFVHTWAEDERVYTRGVPEPQYLPDPSSETVLDGIAASAGGDVFPESAAGLVAQRARQLLGRGPTVVEGTERGRDALAPYLALAAFVPLGLLLWRRDR
jgi:von Willebrand factor type A domain